MLNEDIKRIRRMRKQGMSYREIERLTAFTEEEIGIACNAGKREGSTLDPTPAEIEEMKRQIRFRNEDKLKASYYIALPEGLK